MNTDFIYSFALRGCGYVNNVLRLTDRSWACPACGMVHDRDLNAALNIVRSGMDAMTSDSKSAVCGSHV